MCALTLWWSCKKFASKLSSTGTSRKYEIEANGSIAVSTQKLYQHISLNWMEILNDYEDLKKLADNINAAIGTNLTFFLVVSILDYSVSFDQLFVNGTSKAQDWSGFIILLFYFCNCCAILIVSADANRQVKAFDEDISLHLIAFRKNPSYGLYFYRWGE